jgi:hypothetical protein
MPSKELNLQQDLPDFTKLPRPARTIRTIAPVIDEFVRHRLMGLEVSDESIGNLDKFNQLLPTHSAHVFTNHSKPRETNRLIRLGGNADFLTTISTLWHYAPNIRWMLGPTAIKYSDPEKYPGMAFVLQRLKYLGIYSVPVVQRKDAEKYTRYKTQQIDMLKRVTKTALSVNGNVNGITPEATRSDNAQLAQANEGLGSILLDYDFNQRVVNGISVISSPVLLPMSMLYKPFTVEGEIAQINVGQPFFAEDLYQPEIFEALASEYNDKNTDPNRKTELARDITDKCMLKLTRLLPHRLHGFYADNFKAKP